MERIGLWPNTVLSATAFKDNSKFDVTITSTVPVGSGGTCSVIQGKSLAAPGVLSTFALKVFNVAIDPAEKQRLLRELGIVQRLGGQHRHILHYIGAAEFADRSANLSHVILVSPYMKHGNLLSYIRRNPTVDRLTFILQVADAVAYLHSRHGLVHGDLKCENVLVSDDVFAVLADFGLSTVIEKEDVDEVTVTAIREAFSPRFAAPEILVDTAESPSGQPRSKTTMSDVYAFGMLVLQVSCVTHSLANSPGFVSSTSKSATTGKTGIARGGACVVHCGDACLAAGRIVCVAIKIFVSVPEHDLSRRELRLVGRVRHRYVLPYFGKVSIGMHTALVSPLMRNGNMLEYMKQNPGMDLYALIRQVAEAIEYLHVDEGIVHGDPKCENVLISDKGNALLMDFGLSSFRDSFDSRTQTWIRRMNTVRYAAPEFFLKSANSKEDEEATQPKTKESDIYAFGMLIVHAFSRGDPWGDLRLDKFLVALCSGQLPHRPGGLSDAWWNLCVDCLSFEPASRPTIKKVRRYLTKDVDGFEDFDEWF